MAQGLHKLNARQLRVVQGYISGFAQAVDETHRAWAMEVKDATGRALPYRSIGADPRTIELLSFLDQLMSVQAGFDLDQSQAQLDQYVARSLEAPPTQRLTPLPAPAVVASTAVVGSMEPSMDRSGPQRQVPWNLPLRVLMRWKLPWMVWKVPWRAWKVPWKRNRGCTAVRARRWAGWSGHASSLSRFWT
jgi:hypothetical protein